MCLPSLVAIGPWPWLWGFTSCLWCFLQIQRGHFRFCTTISGSLSSLSMPLWSPFGVSPGLCHYPQQNRTIPVSLEADNDPLPVPWGHFWFSDITSGSLIVFPRVILCCYQVWWLSDDFSFLEGQLRASWEFQRAMMMPFSVLWRHFRFRDITFNTFSFLPKCSSNILPSLVTIGKTVWTPALCKRLKDARAVSWCK